MRKRLAIALALTTAAATAHAAPGDRLRAMFAQRLQQADAQAPAVPAPTVMRYGDDPAQTISYWPALRPEPGHEPAPLIVFVHGGGWSRGSAENATGKWKESHFPAEGIAFASIDYRLVPQVRVEDEAADVAHALAALLHRADALGVDRRRVVLMGHSAGAQLVALVGTDERYLRAAGLSFADLAGVVPIDGAAYDVPAQMADAGRFMQRTYKQAFGEDPARQRALSPTLHAAAPNAPRFLLLHVQRPDGVRQAEALEAALKSAGTQVTRAGFPGEGLKGHMEINRRLGDPTYPATATLDEWLRRPQD